MKEETTANPIAPEEVAAKAVINHPFKGLKTGVRYTYTRKNWPANPDRSAHKKVQHTTTVEEFKSRKKDGTILIEQVVQLNGTGRLYSLHELPHDATFTES